MFAAGKPGFLNTEDLVLVLGGTRQFKVEDPDAAGYSRLYTSSESAADSINVLATRPDGTAYPAAITPVLDLLGSDTWLVTIPVAGYQAGLWRFYAKNDTQTYSIPQNCAVYWGDKFDTLYDNAAAAASSSATAAAQSTTAATQATAAAIDAEAGAALQVNATIFTASNGKLTTYDNLPSLGGVAIFHQVCYSNEALTIPAVSRSSVVGYGPRTLGA